MRVVTRHLTKEILISTGFVLISLVALIAFFDLVGQAKNIGNRYDFSMALFLTVLKLPSRLYEVMPIAALLGAVYTMSRWAANSEFTILRISGLSPMRLAVMLMVPASVNCTCKLARLSITHGQLFKTRISVVKATCALSAATPVIVASAPGTTSPLFKSCKVIGSAAAGTTSALTLTIYKPWLIRLTVLLPATCCMLQPVCKRLVSKSTYPSAARVCAGTVIASKADF